MKMRIKRNVSIEMSFCKKKSLKCIVLETNKVKLDASG